MSKLYFKPSSSSRAMMKAFSFIMAMMLIGMMVAASCNGLLKDGGPFGIVWVLSCIAIAGFVLDAAFWRKRVAGIDLRGSNWTKPVRKPNPDRGGSMISSGKGS